ALPISRGDIVGARATSGGSVQAGIEQPGGGSIAPEPTLHAAVDHGAGALREARTAARVQAAIDGCGVPMGIECGNQRFDPLSLRGDHLEHGWTPTRLPFFGARGCGHRPDGTMVCRNVPE